MPFCIRSHNRKRYPPLYPLVHNHRGRWPPPEPKPSLHHPTHPYIRIHQPTVVGAPYSHRGGRGRSESRGSRRRHVHFADQPTVIDLPTSPPIDPPSAIAPARSRYPSRTPAAGLPPRNAPTPPNSHPAATARQAPSAPAQSRPRSSVSAAAAAAAIPGPGLHGMLASFPPGLWDLRQNARPEYHPQHQPRYPDPVFPSDRGRRSITLCFRPCDRTELSWTAKVRAASCGKRLAVDDVLRAISTELFRRSACRDATAGVCEGHPCYVKARSAQRIRTRRGHTGRPHYDDALRNVDLYHADHGRGLYFEGLRPERLGDGEVVYLVKFGCA